MLAIIGGSSLVKLPILEVTHRQIVRTPYGDPSCPLLFGRIGQQNVVFMARHGYGNSIAPHEINYRANVWALHSVGIKSMIAIGAVGSIRPDLLPGTLVVPDDVLDYTWGRKHTFFEGLDRPLVHADFTRPYCEDLRQRLLAAAGKSQVQFNAQATYACTQGPRLESAAEILKLERDGADIVGMTGMPEASLARELTLAYAHLCTVINWAAGKGNSRQAVTFDAQCKRRSVDEISAVLTKLFE
ncbi:MAG: S-methyl-5'-thioinosine phosphorylase [Vogesella sp.]|uniref:S-methyl-5'-thioinosine phosphorylase n=1 Tax=Vogesella sp. TaxID=1904252 RepID=UPI003F2ED26A